MTAKSASRRESVQQSVKSMRRLPNLITLSLLVGLMGSLSTPASLAQIAQIAPTAPTAPPAASNGQSITAQTRTNNNANPPNSPHTARPLTLTEREALQTLFTKVRPATLRIEQCKPTDCEDADGVGSGVLISADGLALTAYHVVKNARNLSAQTMDEKRHSVTVIGFDSQNDLALLRVNVPKGTPYLNVAAQRPAVGDATLAVGNGGGVFLQPKLGRLLALDAATTLADFPAGTLELNSPLIPGDSGGPILNAKGEVTGIISYIRVTSRTPRSYAVPVTASDTRLADLKRGVKRDTPMIGIGLDPRFNGLILMDEDEFAEVSDILKLGETPGAFFTSVVSGSPAEKAGLVPLEFNRNLQRIRGDIVTEVNGKRIVNFSEFQFAVRAYAPGDTITLTLLRDGKTLKVQLKLTGETQLNPRN